jgi:palmitoyltransferase ZDHHC13/17
LPIEEDLMQLARMGEIGAIQRLFEKGKFSATYKDEEGITPLHVCERLPITRVSNLL